MAFRCGRRSRIYRKDRREELGYNIVDNQVVLHQPCSQLATVRCLYSGLSGLQGTSENVLQGKGGIGGEGGWACLQTPLVICAPMKYCPTQQGAVLPQCTNVYIITRYLQESGPWDYWIDPQYCTSRYLQDLGQLSFVLTEDNIGGAVVSYVETRLCSGIIMTENNVYIYIYCRL